MTTVDSEYIPIIIGIALAAYSFAELLNYILLYRKTDYQSLKSNVETLS